MARSLEEQVWDAIRIEWGISGGTTDSKDVYARLIDAGVEVHRGAMVEVLEALEAQGRIELRGYLDREGIPVHGSMIITEPSLES